MNDNALFRSAWKQIRLVCKAFNSEYMKKEFMKVVSIGKKWFFDYQNTPETWPLWNRVKRHGCDNSAHHNATFDLVKRPF